MSKQQIKTAHIFPLSIRRAIKYRLEEYFDSAIIRYWLEEIYDNHIEIESPAYEFCKFLIEFSVAFVDNRAEEWEIAFTEISFSFKKGVLTFS